VGLLVFWGALPGAPSARWLVLGLVSWQLGLHCCTAARDAGYSLGHVAQRLRDNRRNPLDDTPRTSATSD